MAQQKYTNSKKREKNGGDYEVLGVVLVIISAFILACIVIPPMLGSISKAIYNIMMGLLGLVSYPTFLCSLILGIALIQDRKMSLSFRYVITISVSVLCALLILQLATSYKSFGQGFSEYVSGVYHGLTSGGLLFGVLAYGIHSLIGFAASYVTLSLIIVVMVVIMALPFFSKKARPRQNSVKQAQKPMGFVKGAASAQTVMPISDNSLFVERIAPSKAPISEEQSFDDMPKDISSFTSSNTAFFPPVERDSEKYSKAHNILFGDHEKDIADLAARQGASRPSIDYAKEKAAFTASYSFPSASAAPDIKKPPVVEQVAQKPPKRLHIEDIPALKDIPMPPAKDVSGDYVGGTIINGDDLSRELSEAMPDAKKEQTSSKKIEEAQQKPKEQIENASPIMNGDYFGNAKTKFSAEKTVAAPYVAPQEEQEPYIPPIIKASEASIPKVEPIEPPHRADSAEARFQQLFNEDKRSGDSYNDDLFSSEPPQPITNGDIFSLQKLAYEDDEIEISPKASAFNIIDEVVDLSEKSHLGEEDHTGYYEEMHNSLALDVDATYKEEKQEQKPSVIPQLVRSNAQMKIDDYVASAPIEARPKKKKHARYNPPSIDFLIEQTPIVPEDYNAVCEEKARLLENTLKGLKLPATVNAITRGPAVTRYELEMPPGIPVKRIEQFATDIEYYLASNGKIRIETPIPGKRAVGIEVPNEKIDIVGLRDVIASKEFQNSSSPVTVALGKDIAGTNIVCNLEKMPHLLIAGATGSGKSACLNSIIISLLYKSSPEDVRLILIDPKHVEFGLYTGIPHLLTEGIITDTQQAINALKWARAEVDRRFLLFGKYAIRNLGEYNKCDAVKDGTEQKIPYIVIIVDELAELMLANNRKELEDKIMSMAQKARAAGIHLILATQRPSVDVITGTIKANLPSRIAFSVRSIVDSRTILDQMGAETLLGRGDMLYAPLGQDDPTRVQGAYVTNEEVTTVVNYVRENNVADFDEEIEDAIAVKEEVAEQSEDDEEEKEFDDIMPEVLKCIIESGTASTSMIQRRFSVGYARASRIIDQMELHKFIGPLEGSKPRAVYISREQYNELFGTDI